MENNYEKRAIEILQNAYGKDAQFRDGQLESILAVLNKKKILVIQKTGWGKSVVYFIATKILREEGAGPTIIVSPLLALMKNQVVSAQKLHMQVATINSDNREEHRRIYANLANYDAIIVSPERLSDEAFMDNLANLRKIRLFVVDEAHSISDWGHDFRPDYQRIVKLLDHFPADIAILGTTATANQRVIEDIQRQLGDDLQVVKGDLMRENLAIQVNPCQSDEKRLAWLAQYLQTDEKLKDKQGIIYCLTQRDCETVAEFLKRYGISAEAYHSGLEKDDVHDVAQERITLFDQGKVRILVATIKLGMGYDKSDVGFIIHYQLPQNLISYYQQIGRAGRDGEKAYAILLHGPDDEETLEAFIKNAQADPKLLDTIMREIHNGIKAQELLANINIKPSKLEEALKYLSIHDYIYKDRGVYRKNTALTFHSEEETKKQEALNAMREKELDKMKDYLTLGTCFMEFVLKELDAFDTKTECDICSNCTRKYLIPISVQPEYVEAATLFLKNKHGRILPRKRWADNRHIPEELRFEAGWGLTNEYYSEIGKLVKNGKYKENRFSNELVELSKEYLKDVMKEHIDVVTAVPSLRRPKLVPDFAQRLADELHIPFKDLIHKVKQTDEQKLFQNSYMQQMNIENSIELTDDIRDKVILLVDDMVDSKWTFTVISAKLLQAGAKAVYPFALAKTGKGD